jgi:hypothetical protein
MKEQQSEAPLLFHWLAGKKCQEVPENLFKLCTVFIEPKDAARLWVQ